MSNSRKDISGEIITQERITVYAPQEAYRRLKAKLAMAGLTVTEWFRRKVKEELSEPPIPSNH